MAFYLSLLDIIQEVRSGNLKLASKIFFTGIFVRSDFKGDVSPRWAYTAAVANQKPIRLGVLTATGEDAYIKPEVLNSLLVKKIDDDHLDLYVNRDITILAKVEREKDIDLIEATIENSKNTQIEGITGELSDVDFYHFVDRSRVKLAKRPIVLALSQSNPSGLSSGLLEASFKVDYLVDGRPFTAERRVTTVTQTGGGPHGILCSLMNAMTPQLFMGERFTGGATFYTLDSETASFALDVADKNGKLTYLGFNIRLSDLIKYS